MNLIRQFVTKNECYQVGRKIKVQGLMLHSVGVPQPSAKAFADSWNTYLPNGVEVCVHAFLQANGDVYQILPWDYESWHCGGSANKTHIGVEMCEPDTIRYSGGASWTDLNPAATKAYALGTYKAAVELFAVLCKSYGLNPMKDGTIISHSEGCRRGIASDHADVEHIWNKFGMTMNQFRKDIKAEMKEEEMTKEEISALVDGRIKAYFDQRGQLPANKYAEKFIAYCKEQGFMNGDKPLLGEAEGAFRPQSYLKREELCVVLYNLFEKLREEVSTGD